MNVSEEIIIVTTTIPFLSPDFQKFPWLENYRVSGAPPTFTPHIKEYHTGTPQFISYTKDRRADDHHP